MPIPIYNIDNQFISMKKFNLKILDKPKYAIIYSYILFHGRDYADNIKKQFIKAIENKKWNKKSLRVNSHFIEHRNLSRLLKELEKANLILSNEEIHNGRTRKYYEVDLEVFYFPGFNFKKEELQQFLINFDEQTTIIILNSWPKFDFFEILYNIYWLLAKKEFDFSYTIETVPLLNNYIQYFLFYIKRYVEQDINFKRYLNLISSLSEKVIPKIFRIMLNTSNPKDM